MDNSLGHRLRNRKEKNYGADNDTKRTDDSREHASDSSGSDIVRRHPAVPDIELGVTDAERKPNRKVKFKYSRSNK